MIRLVLALFLLHFSNNIFAQDLNYYLPQNINYNQSIPKPEDVIHHQVGEYHVTHDRLVNYMRAVAAANPDRIKIETMGYTYERRPQVLLIITSKKNHENLEQIRQQHLILSDPERSASLSIDNMPIVVYIGHSIHGNEPSGSNASLLTVYYLAAGQGKEIENMLDNTIILFDPSFNPDGLQRFSTWANQHKSKNLVTDPSSREFNEVWPGGRFNHYWFDLNRDWLPAVHPESQNRLAWFHKWKPNILTDHHEQSSNSTFFFQPGVPSRVNPLTPAMNQELTAKLGRYHAANLDEIGSLYFTKEAYDDFYYGKGSTYPDINGAIGILFEQASSRGHAQQTNNGVLTFPFTIRNQFVTALSTIEGAKDLRKEFLQYQRDFYINALKNAAASSTKAYVFGDVNDEARNQLFIEMLQRHEIDVYALNNTIKNVKTTSGNFDFEKGKAYVVPANQPQNGLIKAIFDKTLEYKDSLFYDITAWTMPMAYGIPYSELASNYNKNFLGEKITQSMSATSGTIEKSNYAYLLEWSDFYAPAALYELQQGGLLTKVASRQFSLPVKGTNKEFGYGTILISVQEQKISNDSIYSLMEKVSKKYSVKIHGITSGNVTAGSDLGSRYFINLEQPRLAMIVGTGVNALDAGEVWHVLDQRFNMPLSMLEQGAFNRVDMQKCNTLVMVGGNYNELNKEKLKSWVQSGGTLILCEEAITWAAQNGISQVNFRKPKTGEDSTVKYQYIDREQLTGAQRLSGAIFGVEIDLTHPLAYGYTNKNISVFKGNRVFMEKGKNQFAVPFVYSRLPLQSGWVSAENKKAIENTASVLVNTVGSGRVINIADNPNFRGFWLGGSKLFMNAIFFGRTIDAASGRVE
ncbi:MAG: zinc carboxypeptidase [Chitinophagaceae bacterium]|nr:zinc carboxypeptidase [Chitinophagaceae bacterium]